MKTAKDLFEHELLDMLDAEQRITKALPKIIEAVELPALKKGFEKHLEQTEGHIERIKQACEMLGIKAEPETCPGMAGLLKEHDTFIKENPSVEVLELFLFGAAQKVEHYEMVGYKGLISMAKQLGETDVAKLLQETLKEEETMASELEKLEKSKEKSLVGAAS
jgi:ferritin-like metal-binding protein YciE